MVVRYGEKITTFGFSLPLHNWSFEMYILKHMVVRYGEKITTFGFSLPLHNWSFEMYILTSS
jgi:hypothetical protein